MADWPLPARRALAVFLLILCLVSLWGCFIGPWVELVTFRQNRVEVLDRQLSGNQHLLTNEENIDADLASLNRLDGDDVLLFSGDKPAIAAAGLREFISQMVSESGGQLVSVQEFEAVEGIKNTQTLGLRAHLTGEAQSLVGFLYALENARPVIFIDKLTVTTNRRSSAITSRRRARPSSTYSQRNSLDMRLDLNAYIVAK